MTLANDSVLVTPGSGATIATHLVGGKEYQVVMLADPAGHVLDSLDTWWAFADAVAFAQNKQHISLFNATGSGKIVKVRKLFAINLAVVAITGVMTRFDFKRITAASVGTVITPNAADTNNAALPAGITVRTNGTVTEGALLFAHAVTSDEVGATNAFPTPQILAELNLVPEARSIQELTLREGQGVTVKQITAVTAGTFGWLAVFTVE